MVKRQACMHRKVPSRANTKLWRQKT